MHGMTVERRAAMGRVVFLLAGLVPIVIGTAMHAGEGSQPLPDPSSQQIDFAQQIRPIFQAKCYSCHGVDESEGGLRLDARSAALAGGDRGAAIVAGSSRDSLLILAVAGLEEDLQMPPEDEGTPLSADQIARLRAWIDQGAPWPESADGADTDVVRGADHWAFQPIASPEPPSLDDTWIRNGIDAFVLRQLERKGVQPAAEADRAMLLRRLYLDLIGLPPTPEQWVAAMADERADWYQRLVDRLLESPHYGERWARLWLDQAHYAYSDGYEKDLARPHAWRWREWVIDALNNDMPFDQFTIEQLAGDLLPDATTDQQVATGFQRNTLINREGGVDPKEDRVKRTVDRTNVLGSVWLGMTVECAHCHSHKYDPLTQREYFRLYAFFDSEDEPDIPAPLPAQMEKYGREKASFDARHAELVTAVTRYRDEELSRSQAAWEASQVDAEPVWVTLRADQAISIGGAKLDVQPDGSIKITGPLPEKETYEIEARIVGQGITGLRLELLPDDNLPQRGPGRAANGNLVLSELRLTAAPVSGDDPAQAAALKFAVARARFSQKGWPIAAAIDSNAATGWGVLPQTGQLHTALFELAKPVAIDGETVFTVTLEQSHGSGHTIGRFRISVTKAPRPIPFAGLTDRLVKILTTPADSRGETERSELDVYYRSIDTELRRLEQAVRDHAGQAPTDPRQNVKAQVVAERAECRPTHIHLRGDFLNKGAAVDPGTPAVLPPLAVRGARPDRLDLARWLVDPVHPLTSRVTVNRIWQHYFGRGLVASDRDFGTQGDPPSHPELLDWLATRFRREGWSLKSLHRWIVGSATYRQSSAARPELLQRDPYNSWLARQNRLRVEAEIVRDLALAASGLLSDRVGGPSVRPPQPEGLAMLGYAGQVKWKASDGQDRYRRGLYTFFQRTVPYPMLLTFDAPDSNVTCTRRERSNTPLQALTLWNDPVFVECAQALGRRIVTDVPSTADAPDRSDGLIRRRIEHAFLLALARKPVPADVEDVRALFEAERNVFADDGAAADALVGELPRPGGQDVAELATWIVVGRTVINLDEFITRE